MRRKSSACVVEQREVVLFGIVLDEPLHHPDAGRAVAQHGVGHDVPAERLRHLVRRDLAVAQRAAREVPQRSLAALRLVDREHLVAVVARRFTRNVAFDDHGMRPSTSTSPSRNSSRRARRPTGHRRRSLSSSAGRCARRDPSGSRTAGTAAGPPSTAPTPLRDHRPDLRARRVRAARRGLRSRRAAGGGFVVVLGRVLAQLDQHEVPLGVVADADQPGAGTAARPRRPRRRRDARPSVAGSSGCSSAMRSRNCSASAASSATCSFSTSTESTRVALAGLDHERARAGLPERARRRSRRRDRTR